MEDHERLLLSLIHYHLKDNNFKETLHSLESESRFFFDMEHMEQLVVHGEWDALIKYLSGFTGNNPLSIGLSDHIRRRKELEAANGAPMDRSRFRDLLKELIKLNPDIKGKMCLEDNARFKLRNLVTYGMIFEDLLRYNPQMKDIDLEKYQDFIRDMRVVLPTEVSNQTSVGHEDLPGSPISGLIQQTNPSPKMEIMLDTDDFTELTLKASSCMTDQIAMAHPTVPASFKSGFIQHKNLCPPPMGIPSNSEMANQTGLSHLKLSGSFNSGFIQQTNSYPPMGIMSNTKMANQTGLAHLTLPGRFNSGFIQQTNPDPPISIMSNTEMASQSHQIALVRPTLPGSFNSGVIQPTNPYLPMSNIEVSAQPFTGGSLMANQTAMAYGALLRSSNSVDSTGQSNQTSDMLQQLLDDDMERHH